jgi:hypothetical protein
MDEIKPYWRNPRINDNAVGSVKKSIEKFGYRNLIVVDPEHVIIVGHTRYKALKELGYAEAHVIVADLDSKAAREYRIIDNKTSEKAAWDHELLIPEIRSVDLSSFIVDFPELDIKPVNVNFEPPTETEITKAQTEHDDRFTELAQQRNANNVSDVIMCPECGHEFELL